MENLSDQYLMLVFKLPDDGLYFHGFYLWCVSQIYTYVTTLDAVIFLIPRGSFR